MGTEVGGRKIWADTIVEMKTDGTVVWEWKAWEHLDPAADALTALQDDRNEWTHCNAVVELPDGNLLASFRNISTVIRIDRNTGRILWKLGAPPLSGQHAPTLLTNGNILIFDNGPHRLDESFVNPYFGPAHLPEKQQNNGVFRVDRYSEDEVDRMRRV